MAVPVIMPKLGQSVESCIITEWYKRVGDKVEIGELLFAYETDKASFVYEAKDEGLLLEIFSRAGDEVPVHTTVAVIGNKGENYDSLRPEVANTGIAAPGESTSRTVLPEPGNTLVDQASTKSRGISPRARKKAEQLHIPVSDLKGTGPGGRIIERDIQVKEDQHHRITPLARAMMEKEHLQYDKDHLPPYSRITSKDLVNPSAPGDKDYDMIRLSNIRRIIAENMVRSLHTAAQLTHHTSADASRILTLRKSIKQVRETTPQMQDITLNDMVCFALVKALLQHPEVNAHFLGDSIRVFHGVHLGMAVDTSRGLMVPVLENAQACTLRDLSFRLKDLAARCQAGNIDPDLLSSEKASFTVSNLGAYGIEMFTPVLNLPQVGILGVNTIVMRPVVIRDQTIQSVPFIGLSLTYDHRAVDGAPASRFLQRVKEEIENFPISI
jgi:pyruvate dehydrogenase E2 component (dihydrolipoyllysine-residue acetyltransferase)